MGGMQQMMLGAKASLSPSAAPNLTGNCSNLGGSCNAVSTGSATVTVTGGSGSYTYSWVHTGGTAMTINNPTGATTSVQRSAAVGQILNGTLACDVTDTVFGQTVRSNSVNFESTHNDTT